jgi:hypothetical protein
LFLGSLLNKRRYVGRELLVWWLFGEMKLHLHSHPDDPGRKIAHEKAMHAWVRGSRQGVQFLPKLVYEPPQFSDLFGHKTRVQRISSLPRRLFKQGHLPISETGDAIHTKVEDIALSIQVLNELRADAIMPLDHDIAVLSLVGTAEIQDRNVFWLCCALLLKGGNHHMKVL